MAIHHEASVLLFSYGTLQLASVQLANFDRLLEGQADSLPAWRQELLEITDAAVLAQSGQRYHPILRYTGAATDAVSGTVFSITPEELLRADAYEVGDYQRVRVALASGQIAWVYVARDCADAAPKV